MRRYAEYASLMSNNEGTFLYNPHPLVDLHPGSVGFFNSDGRWNQITDITEGGRLQKQGYTAFKAQLTRASPIESLWKTKSSESGSSQHLRLTGGLSAAAAAAAPVDVSAEGKQSWASSGKAALQTMSAVIEESYSGGFKKPVRSWIAENAEKLVHGNCEPEIKENGIWVVQTTWHTQECAIIMTNSKDQNIDLGFDVGMTGIAKVGSGGEISGKSTDEGWSMHKAKVGEQGLVVSFKGIHFKPRTLKFMGVRGDPTHNTLTLGRSLTDHRYQPLKEISERRMISRLHTLEPEAYRIGENGALEKVEGPGDSDKEKEEKQEITPELTVTYETVSKKNLQQIWEELKQKNERGELEEKLMKRLEEALQPAPTMEDTEYTGEGLEEVVLLEPDDDDDDDDEEE